jgi:uncharacterized protein (TIGR00106 family)
MLAEFSIFPTDKGESVSQYVAQIIGLIDKSGLPYKLTPMGTVVEGDWDEVIELIGRCHKKMRGLSNRVYTTIKIDDREGKSDMLHSKIASIKEKLN